jgi:hypothetical protein
MTTDEYIRAQRAHEQAVVDSCRPVIRYATRLFIDGVQVGDNATFMDSAASLEAAQADTRETFEKDGKTVSIEVTELPQWPSTPPVLTFIVNVTNKPLPVENTWYCSDCGHASENEACDECELICDEVCGRCGEILDNCDCGA